MMLGSTLILKVMVAGNGGVGKTTLIRSEVVLVMIALGERVELAHECRQEARCRGLGGP